MSKKAGVWIDRHKAVVVTLENEQAEVQTVESAVQPRVRFSSGTRSRVPKMPRGSTAEDMRDRQLDRELEIFLDRVLPLLRGSQKIWLIGPAETKEDLAKLLKAKKPAPVIDGIESFDKLTDAQIVQKVKEHFNLELPGRRLPPE